MSSWQELTVEILHDAEEAASSILIELGSQGVMIDDSADYPDRVGKYGEVFSEIKQVEAVKITAYYPENINIKAAEKGVIDRLARSTGFGVNTGDVRYVTQELAERDWVENWKKYYEPTRASHDLTIVPSRTDYGASEGEKTIRPDPGMTFGTGTHPATRMSLFALEQVLRDGETVLDISTGPDVFSIVNSLLRAKDIHTYDFDEVAVRVAQENTDLDANTEDIHIVAGDLSQGVGIQADAVVTNILADILVNMTEDAYRLIKNEGHLTISDIISNKWDVVRKSTKGAGFSLETHMVQGEWNACVFRKTDDISGVIGG